MKKEGQAWGFDLVVGMVIFIVGIVSFYLYTTNLSGASQEVIGQLQQEGEMIADSLMSEGSPIDWDASNVARIGVLSDARINETKWAEFKSLTYGRTKALFRVRNEYFVYIGNDVANGVGLDASGATNLVKITRVVVYNQSVATLNIYSWN
ncbi:MAG: hypothetical protein KKD18_04605 [Nanoarchaeota archaeon]|nr:hypothetical protein [Nanoarchaeota archaeon]MBU0977671.1 hypothetical protein [Nanoarchaeota archaeon]